MNKRIIYVCIFCFRSQRDDSAVTAASVPVMVPLGDKDAIMNSIADSYLANNELTKHKKYHKIKKLYKKIREYENIIKYSENYWFFYFFL